MNEIGHRLNLQLEYVSIPFDGLMPMLEAETADVAISAITITPERAEAIDFSRPCFKSGLGIAARQESTDIQSLGDLAGRKIAAKLGTTGAIMANDIPQSQVVMLDSTELVLKELVNKNVDAVINDAPATLGLLTQG